jgi:sporulation protein YlmC with PRC-barrel domain
MMKYTTVSSVLILLSSLSVPTFANQESKPRNIAKSTSPSSSVGEADEVILDQQLGVLATPDGEVIGGVIDFVFDLQANRVLYTAGVLHSSEDSKSRVFVFPWRVVQMHPDLNAFTLSEDKTILQKAPSFPLEAWPDLPPARLKAALTTAWKEKDSQNSAASLAPDIALSKASDLIGKTVKNAGGKDIGTLAELLIDPEKGSIAYAILSLDVSGSNSQTLFYPLLWTTVQVDPVQLTFVVPDFVKEEFHDHSLLFGPQTRAGSSYL